MALHVKIDEELVSKTSKNTGEVHLMPCKIHHDGPANVSTYFTPYISEKSPSDESSDKVLQASFRGRLLLGQQIEIPENFTGYVLSESKKPLSEESDRKLHCSDTFQGFTYWNWDHEPTKNDAVQQVFEWLDVSQAIHQNVDDQDEK
nr:EOG090X0IC1 [Eulimnadia texana]